MDDAQPGEPLHAVVEHVGNVALCWLLELAPSIITAKP
jgi:hypothetical protein